MVKNDLSSDRFGWAWIWGVIFSKKTALFSILLATGVVYCMTLVIPLGVQHAIDIITSRRNTSHLMWIAPMCVVAVMIESVLSMWRQVRVINLGSYLERRISRHIFMHLMRMRVDGIRLGVGDILNRFQQVTKIREFSLYRLPQTVFDVGGAVVSVIAIFHYDVTAGIAILFASLFACMLFHRPVVKLRERSAEFANSMGGRQDVLSETVYGLDTIKALAMEPARLRAWGRATDRMLDALRALLHLNWKIVTSTQIASRLLTLVVIGIGGWHVLNGTLSFGGLVAMQLLVGRATGALLAGGSDIFRALQEANVALEQIDDFLRQPREYLPVPTVCTPASSASIRIESLRCTYGSNRAPALQDVTLELPPRGVIALIGRNGSGKSTLIRILSGMQRNFDGDVWVGDHSLRDFGPRAWRKQVGVVLQETVLFSGSVRSNLAIDKHTSERQLRHALEFAGASEFVEALPHGLDTNLEAGGRSLSGGQRQRLAIARAVVRQPKIVFFDEPTSFLDVEAAVQLEERLTQWGRNRLLFLVTHNLAAASKADHIIMLDRGRILGHGSHVNLLCSIPEYASLYADYTRAMQMAS
ncbi:peptidase domain-containing ABC transporter [Burkholderia cepacia]|uniref:peptidase domain-containing ABC transporter n=1 Tax=Burkholderia cepacia TaxID=292 RepID=UPI0009BCCA23|nr:ATP-binding cassette domain-containing protein [Burkholderia cepacia]